MKICYIFDDSYISQFLTVTNSIISNEKKELVNSIEFYIAYFGSKENIATISELAKSHFPNNRFCFKHIPSEFPELELKYNRKYDFKNSAAHIQTSSVLCRFDLDEIFPEIDERILYLDLDIMVRHNISELFNSLQGSSIFYACNHRIIGNEITCVNFNEEVNSQHVENFILDVKNGYDRYIEKTTNNKTILQNIITTNYDFNSPAFNAGVFILDLKQYRENQYFKEFAKFLIEINRHENILRHNDQSILNIIFYGYVKNIDPRWNATDYGWHNKKEEKSIKERFSSSYLIHFCGPEKPWSPSFQHSSILNITTEHNNKPLKMHEFYMVNELDQDFNEIEYAKKFPETKGFYYQQCLHFGFSEKHRLYYHYCMYGNAPTQRYINYFLKGIKLWKQYEIKGN
jgi:lipopolysaccharide biosynthesis glycosyltransferase